MNLCVQSMFIWSETFFIFHSCLEIVVYIHINFNSSVAFHIWFNQINWSVRAAFRMMRADFSGPTVTYSNESTTLRLKIECGYFCSSSVNVTQSHTRRYCIAKLQNVAEQFFPSIMKDIRTLSLILLFFLFSTLFLVRARFDFPLIARIEERFSSF